MFENNEFLTRKIMSIEEHKEEVATFDDVHSFTSTQVTRLAKAISATCTLKVLNLAMIFLKPEQLKQLGDAILENNSIETLLLPTCETDSSEMKEFLSKIHEHVSTHAQPKPHHGFVK